jgi:peptidoglycan/xylan/chitin deacetylase (PgdA/CDA1 family)
MPITILPQKVHIGKLSVVFTWDDNLSRQIDIIAPLFIEHNWRCTFYVNPGEDVFKHRYYKGYKALAEKGFEVASHGYSHKWMAEISNQEREFEFSESIKEISKHIHHHPITFAFPAHNSNDNVVAEAKQYHLETRNTLANSRYFRIQSATDIAELTNNLEVAITHGNNYVFSGHSIITETEYLNNEKGEGWQPIRVTLLSTLLNYIENSGEKIEVITFAQASLKEFIRKHNLFKEGKYEFNDEALTELEKVGVNAKTLNTLL